MPDQEYSLQSYGQPQPAYGQPQSGQQLQYGQQPQYMQQPQYGQPTRIVITQNSQYTGMTNMERDERASAFLRNRRCKFRLFSLAAVGSLIIFFVIVFLLTQL
ncbi:unnamed protein product [Blepharisma stoltei]|uniref:Uncharacterized protein n=1 Tax=Blepharisma stoltei TaxID=1481888 RepID=A0AAU9J4N1_9CILI|nr:unnamed protein product [Blepharisma stoltei]